MPIKYRIHPAIGIARVGDSPDDFFVGPEAPGVAPTLNKPDGSSSQPGKYKDRMHRIKRQGARFRVYEYTEGPTGAVTKVREITAAEAQIEWEVHLANRKAAEKTRFSPVGSKTPRNKEVTDRSKLIIDPRPQRISGANQPTKALRGKFMDTVNVKLGDLLTDGEGRLIVLGGHGHSGSHDGRPLRGKPEDFADNDGWCDDTSDGAVSATIKLNGSNEKIAADPAWVIVAPPDFAPHLQNVVTLYDVVYGVAATLDRSLAVTDATRVSFTNDIYPILRRVSNVHWVSDLAAAGHAEESAGHFVSRVNELARNDPQDNRRNAIFRRLREPKGGGGDMPKLGTSDDIPGISLTVVQYERMKRWAAGKFVADWPGAEPAPTPLDKLPETDQPRALDRAALESCVGGPFFPGIEAGRIMLEPSTYDKTRQFRISSNLPPGTLTARMAVPWQADFFACEFEAEANMDWWPGQRPDQVLSDSARVPWRRGVSSMNEMVEKWKQLGFVVERKKGDKVEYVEDERNEPSPPVA
jgi:hypothetical protein